MNYNQPDLNAQVFPLPYHAGLANPLPGHTVFSTGLNQAVEDSALSGTSRKAHAVRSHMTCCSLWKSLCVPEHEDGVKCFLSASLLLSFNTRKKWTAMPDQRHQQRHKCYQATLKTKN